MIHQVSHPLLERDMLEIVDHILATTGGDTGAVERRLEEIDGLIDAIAANPFSGSRLAGQLHGWLVRHGGRGHRITVVFRASFDRRFLYIALVAFGGRDWLRMAIDRRGFGR